MKKLGLNGMTFSSTDDLENILKIANEFGINNIELWAHNCEDEGDTIHQYAYKGRNLKKTKDLLKKYGIEVCCVAFGCGFDAEFVKQQKEFSRELERAVEVAAELEAKIVNHYCVNILPSPVIDMPRLESYWLSSIKRAEELGVTLALENEAHDVTQTPDNMLKIIEYFDSENFKTNFDATNYYQSSNEAFPYAYEVLKRHIVYIHLKNGCIYNPDYCMDKAWIGGTLSGKMSGGKIYYTDLKNGSINFYGLLNRIKNDGYSGFYTFEPHSIRQNALDCIKNDILYLKDINYI